MKKLPGDLRIVFVGMLALLFLVSVKGSAQTRVFLDTLENREQRCLDNGENMLGCSANYYEQMDSMLNHVYHAIRLRLNDSQRSELKTKQLAWLKKRDKNSADEYAEAKKDFEGSDLHMIVFHKQALYVSERIIELINQYGDVPLPTWAH